MTAIPAGLSAMPAALPTAAQAAATRPASTRPATRSTAEAPIADAPAVRTLGELRRGERAIICGLDEACDAEVRHRLRQLGFSEGREVELVRRAPLGSPIVVRVCDTQICLRREQTDAITIDPIRHDSSPADALVA